MSQIKRIIGRLLFPHRAMFIDDVSSAFVRSVREIESFDTDVKGLCSTWLAVCPHTYFSELFLETESWNGPFVQAFERSGMVNAHDCYILTQAFYFRHLSRVIGQDKEYRQYSKDTIANNIVSHMDAGTRILALASDFEEDILNITAAADLSMCYVEKILETQYRDREILKSVLASIWIESISLFGLAAFTVESIRRAKYIDSQSSLHT